jgi:hypothetical protein
LAPKPSTTGEVDYLVGLPKVIKFIPKAVRLDRENHKGWEINARVFDKAKIAKPIPGLVVKAKAHEAPSGLPHPPPSAALEWFGKRIRGINYELWHDNPDGSSVRGWHEHLWSPGEQDAHVVLARPEPTKKQLLDILKWGLSKWNIEILMEQGRLPYEPLD